jgi:protein-tyrosine phosphatase
VSDRQGPIPNSYWVVPGRLLAGEYPAAREENRARRKLAAFRHAGIRCFVDLTEEGEYGLPPYAAIAAEGGAEHRRFPIPDLGVPTPSGMRSILDHIDTALERGKNVYVHCFGGIGRTGTVVGCYLVRHGTEPDEALASIARWREGTPDGRRHSPETAEQQNVVLGWDEPAQATEEASPNRQIRKLEG